MSERGASYALVGFSKEIDFRPLRFVEPLPENRICSVCRYVPKTTFFLPCCHVLCEPCYEECKASGEACALDAQGCPEEEVECRTVSPEKILRKHFRKASNQCCIETTPPPRKHQRPGSR
ncbi:uncharacterized protein LOC144105064 isoform X2 [Amblyomma americanum]